MKKNLKISAAIVLTLSAASLFGTASTEPVLPFRRTSIDGRLNLQLNKDTQVVHLVRTDTDPDVYTKTYVLKHADPYEIRYYLYTIAKTCRVKVNEAMTGVQAIKFADGTGMLMVSAEDYRFEESPNAQSIDSIVQLLDKPKIMGASGSVDWLYLPKYRSIDELKNMVEAVGGNTSGDDSENIGGNDGINLDHGLNLLFFHTPRFSKVRIERALKDYDIPYPEVRAKVTVYELFAENDTKLGLDFQAWKNNDGIDFFSAGGRFSQNADATSLIYGNGWNDTTYFNFNPKWNTKYVDFLTSKGKAKVLISNEMTLRNNQPGTIRRLTQCFTPVATKIEDQAIGIGFYAFNAGNIDSTVSITARDHDGEVAVFDSSKTNQSQLSVVKLDKNGTTLYTITSSGKDLALSKNGTIVKSNQSKLEMEYCSIQTRKDTSSAWEEAEYSSYDYDVQKGSTVDLESSGVYGFEMTATPQISSDATILTVNVKNSSLIGYTANGSPRIVKGAGISNNFMISNKGTKLVLGGIEKRDVVRVSGGLPFFKDLPGIGWIFSTESESTKRSQLLVVCEVIPVKVDAKLSAKEAAELKKIETELKKAGETNSYGYRQFLLDKDRVCVFQKEEKKSDAKPAAVKKAETAQKTPAAKASAPATQAKK